MTRQQLVDSIFAKKSFLCVGLDTDIQLLPQCLKAKTDAGFEFNKNIIDATAAFATSIKINTAFYECDGLKGWELLERTAHYIKQNYPEIFLIADAKRGDIGNTSKMYARAFLQNLPFDAITVAPYMGADSVKPFLEFENKWVIVLALTSNSGASDFQTLTLHDSQKKLYHQVLEAAVKWGTANNMMFVTGATRAEMLSQIREIIPHHFLLVPGVGAQGGSLSEVAKHAYTKDCGLLVNSSRGIIYASGGDDYAAKAAAEAEKLQQQMMELMGL